MPKVFRTYFKEKKIKFKKNILKKRYFLIESSFSLLDVYLSKSVLFKTFLPVSTDSEVGKKKIPKKFFNLFYFMTNSH